MLGAGCRLNEGRDPHPSAGILDTQSVKNSSVGGVRGYDGAKKLSGRNRHPLVDTLGMVLKTKVHAADLQDRAAVPLVLEGIKEKFPRLEHVWVKDIRVLAGSGSKSNWAGVSRWSSIHPSGGSSGDPSAIWTISQASGLSGFEFQLNRRDLAARSR